MSYEAARFQCEECGDKFLSELALRGHRSVHAEERRQRLVSGP